MGKLGSPPKSLAGFLEKVKEILYEINPFKIILFGSAAGGELNANSDIDLLIILDSFKVNPEFSTRLDNRVSVSRLLRDIQKKLPLDIMVLTREEERLAKESGNMFYQEIFDKGVIVYEKRD